MEARKKSYAEPELTVYGNVEVITQNGNQANADSPNGINNAFSNA